MRPSWLGWSLFSLLAVPALASAVDISSSSDGMRLSKRTWSSEVTGPTEFNGLEVPPIREITPDNFEELTKDGYW
jgi:protein disulfide-isomerase